MPIVLRWTIVKCQCVIKSFRHAAAGEKQRANGEKQKATAPCHFGGFHFVPSTVLALQKDCLGMTFLYW
jgi:hypothetical protein